MKSSKFPPQAFLAMTAKKMLSAFKQGYRPSRDVTASQLYRLSDMLREAADQRMASARDNNEKNNGGIQHTTVVLDRAQLAFIVACMDAHEEPISCSGLTKKLILARDSLVGDVEEDESAPMLKLEATLHLEKQTRQ